MRKIFLFVSSFVILLMATSVSAQGIHCPDSGKKLRFKGPGVKTELSGRTTLKCRYYDDRYKKGTISAVFYKDYKKGKGCRAKAKNKYHLISEKAQVEVTFKDENKRDEYKDDMWGTMAKSLLTSLEAFAISCDNDSRRVIKRALKKHQESVVQDRQTTETSP